jgi:hypothetical protein
MTATPNPQIRLAGYALDPLIVANALGGYGPQINEAAANLFALRDQLLAHKMNQYNLGNMSLREATGGNYDGIGYRVTPEVFYKRQVRGNPTGGPVSPVEFLTLRDVPMLDWDVNDPTFHKMGSQVQNLGDVEELIRDYQKRNPYSNMRLYQTPGGYRAFEFGKISTPQKYQRDFSQLNVDPNYAELNKFKYNLGAGEIDTPGFRARISGKPGRIDPGNELDFVALPIAELSGKNPQMIPRSKKVIDVVHDDPIRNYLIAQKAQPAALEIIKKNLPTASSSLQSEIRRRLRL